MTWTSSSFRLAQCLAACVAAFTCGEYVEGQTRVLSTSDPLGSVSSSLSSRSQEIENRDKQFEALQTELSSLERQVGLLRRVVKLVSPTVVHIEATKDPHADNNLTSAKDTKRIEEAGAGVVVELSGRPFVITNRHVIYPSRLESIRIQLSDRTVVSPTRIWSDPSTDIAVMAIPGNQYTPARLGDSSKVEIGDFVLAVGSPFGLAHSVTYGIISAKGRRNLELGNKAIEIQDFFQTDAAINPGNSGGPLMNLRGEVVAINTAIASNSGGNEGIGFSIPINLVVNVARQLIEQGQLVRGYLGVQMENSFDASKARRLGLEQPIGALVKAIKTGSPAEKAGVQVGDIVIEFDGVRIDNDGHLVQTVGLTPIGREVEALILRGGKRFRTKVTLTKLPSIE